MIKRGDLVEVMVSRLVRGKHDDFRGNHDRGVVLHVKYDINSVATVWLQEPGKKLRIGTKWLEVISENR